MTEKTLARIASLEKRVAQQGEREDPETESKKLFAARQERGRIDANMNSLTQIMEDIWRSNRET